MKHQWKPCPGYESSHEVSSTGEVRSIDRDVQSCYGCTVRRKGKTIKQDVSSRYPRVQLMRRGRKELVHRLVALAFVPNPMNKPQINHINGVKTDNRARNLEWSTCAENIQHAFASGLSKNKKGDHNPQSLPVYLYKDGVEHRFESTRQAAEFLGTSLNNLGHTLSGNRSQCLGYVASRTRITSSKP
jgi:hypothetical protein